MDQATTLRVRERAYHIWAAQGGDAEKTWLQAETEILQLMTARLRRPRHRNRRRAQLETENQLLRRRSADKDKSPGTETSEGT